jgi:SacI homology domain
MGIRSCRVSVAFLLSLALLLAAEIHRGISTPTGLSGFGARSLTKTIFPLNSNITVTPLSTTPHTIVNAIFSKQPELVSDRPRLWAKRSRDPDILYFQIRNDENIVTRTLRIIVVDQRGNWRIEMCSDEDSVADEDSWAPIDGIYGLYRLPSGIMWVLVTKTKPVYTAPLLSDDQAEPWWQIRKVSNFELVHLSTPGMLMMSTTQLKEEVRQLRLLRQSLKEHEFFYVPLRESYLVRDMTCNLQRSFETYLEHEVEDLPLWWDSEGRKPDPRFFWNQAAVEPILQRYESTADDPGQQMIVSDLLSSVIPLTSAFVGIQEDVTAPDTGLNYDQLLISRRSRFRAGTRFTRRGADVSGAVANFAETEQVCLLRNGTHVTNVLSHLQTRGSIPLRWSSPADVKTYRPRVRIGTDPLAQARALRLHLLDQFSHYVRRNKEKQLIRPTNSSGVAKLIFVNLVDKTHDQGRLGRAFDAVLRAVMDIHSVSVNATKEDEKKKEDPPPKRHKFAYLYDLRPDPVEEKRELRMAKLKEESMDNELFAENVLCDRNSVEHVWFDFHAEVKDGRWDRLQGLLRDLQPALRDHGYFMASAPNGASSSWRIHQSQNAIVRTNCMDCLDRTNVVQSLFGRFVLFDQLSALMKDSITNTTRSGWDDYIKSFEVLPTAIPWEHGEKAHRLLWADNADAISQLYAGTPALKGDFTRTGERTKRGALNDGVNSLQRYYLNNFLDADRQEGIDLLVGYVAFSDVGDLEDSWVSSSDQNDENKFISIKNAAREIYFDALVGRLEDDEAAKIQQQHGLALEPLVDNSPEHDESVDLRWISGDLQSHMISNVDAMLVESSSADGRETAGSFEFSTGKALISIDRRSYLDLPWWAYTSDDDDDDSVPSYERSGGMVGDEVTDKAELLVPEFQRFPRLDKSQVLGMVLLALRAPTGLATAIIGLLVVIFLPDIL